jgi:hypothetical protein
MKDFIKRIPKALKKLQKEFDEASRIAYGQDYLFTDRFVYKSKKENR